MKTLHIIIVSLVLQLPMHLLAQKAEKRIEKSFAASQFNVLSLQNKFGNIDILTSETNQISIKVHITVENRSEEKARDILNNIEIVIQPDGKTLRAETHINTNTNNTEFHIDYQIELPKSIQIDAHHRYGNLYANSLSGTHHFDLSYGNLKIDELLNQKAETRATIELAYGKATIGKCLWLDLSIKYSKLTINQAQAVVINSKYSKVQINAASSIVGVSRYDSPVEIGQVNNLKLETAYSTLKIGKLNYKLLLESRYTDFKIEEIAPSFNQLGINASYSNGQVPIPQSVGYQIEASAQYGSINLPGTDQMRMQRDGNSASYSGHVGASGNQAQVQIQIRYGNINLQP